MHTARMRQILALITAAVACTALATQAGAAPKPALRLVSTTPLVVAGTGFKAGTKVRVTADVDSVRARTVRVGKGGGFTVRFADAFVFDRCGVPIVIEARISGNLRALLKRPQPACPLPGRAEA